jgi:uncharacterized protein
MRPGLPAAGALAVLLLWCLLLPLQATAGEHRLFWKAESPDGVIWLLGSLHFGDPSMFPLPPAITDALATADVLAVEADITAHAPASIAETISRRGLYHDDQRLRHLVDDETWQALADAAAELGLPEPLLERQKPWFASMTLTTLALARYGFHSDLGIDMHIMGLAAEHGLPIVELESIEEQLELLDGLSERSQILMLEQTLQQLADTERYFRMMLGAWLDGDADRLAAILVEELHDPDGDDELYRLLLVDRNRTMQRDIIALLTEHDVVFVVVGAGHMVGEDGIVEGLKAAGYKINQPGR